ncbi:MAG TPA: hypothetical protein VHH94_01060 [Gammaproteobacteria bacterium]|jgi:hypothetical protein|nr:hypothetical protein [Gammaproteobacteria bacterium]
MGRVTKAVAHLQVEGIDERIKQCAAPWRIRGWQVIRCALVSASSRLQKSHWR